MSFFRNQLANVVEWEEFRDDMIFYKWNNREIKKGSRLIIRPGQDAVFLNNGRVEGVFKMMAIMILNQKLFHSFQR